MNTDGSADTNFNANVYAAILTNPPYYPGQIAAIVVQPDGKVLYAGETLLRLNSDGTLDTNFNSAAIGYVYSMARHPRTLAHESGPAQPGWQPGQQFQSWPVTGLNFQLQENTDLSLPNSWSPVAQPAVTNGGQISVTVPAGAQGKFFRLKSQ